LFGSLELLCKIRVTTGQKGFTVASLISISLRFGVGDTIFNLATWCLTNRALPNICPKANSHPFLNRKNTKDKGKKRKQKPAAHWNSLHQMNHIK
jgi:hypothetical protein